MNWQPDRLEGIVKVLLGVWMSLVCVACTEDHTATHEVEDTAIASDARTIADATSHDAAILDLGIKLDAGAENDVGLNPFDASVFDADAPDATSTFSCQTNDTIEFVWTGDLMRSYFFEGERSVEVHPFEQPVFDASTEPEHFSFGVFCVQDDPTNVAIQTYDDVPFLGWEESYTLRRSCGEIQDMLSRAIDCYVFLSLICSTPIEDGFEKGGNGCWHAAQLSDPPRGGGQYWVVMNGTITMTSPATNEERELHPYGPHWGDPQLYQGGYYGLSELLP